MNKMSNPAILNQLDIFEDHVKQSIYTSTELEMIVKAVEAKLKKGNDSLERVEERLATSTAIGLIDKKDRLISDIYDAAQILPILKDADIDSLELRNELDLEQIEWICEVLRGQTFEPTARSKRVEATKKEQAYFELLDKGGQNELI